MTFERGRLEDEVEFRTAERVPVVRVFDAPLHNDARARHNFYRRLGKRLFDVALVVLAAPVWVPLMLLIAALAMSDRGNPFYSQNRVGLAGRTFRMWKIRTMVVDAEDILARHLAEDPAIRAEWDEKQKLTKDPRITRFGRLLRMTSLDELPQLWNVLIGDMSLVGPRPMMVDQQVIYTGSAYYALRPGVTGTWQISARNKASFRERAIYDEQYIENCSFWLDLRTLLRTVVVVLAARGV